LLGAVLAEAREKELLSAEHFTVDGTLIQAWAASHSFEEKNDPPAPGAGSGRRGTVLLRDKVESKTDPDARLYKKATADKSVPSYLGHALMENRNGLVVAAQASRSAAAAEREAAQVMVDRVVKARRSVHPGKRSRWEQTRNIKTRSLSWDCENVAWRHISANIPRAWPTTARTP